MFQMLVDSHAHLDVPQFDADRDEVIARARQAGVGLMLEICGSDVAKGSLDTGLRLADEHSFIFAAVGLHPHEASLWNDALESRLCAMCEHDKVIGWGEIGLDYYYDHSPRERQQEVFRRQLELALERRLPVIVHTRDAEDDTAAILRQSWAEKGGSGIGGIIHCFTGTRKLAEAALEMGFHISFSGVVTFRNAGELRDVARAVPDERLLVETDCPYLAPVPHRGKRNEPAYVIETAAFLAEIKGLSPEEMAAITTANFLRLFKMESNQGCL